MNKALWILFGATILLVVLVGRQVNAEVESMNPKIGEIQMRVGWVEEDIVTIRERIKNLEGRLDTAIRMIPDYHDSGWYEKADFGWQGEDTEDITTATIDPEVLVPEKPVVSLPDEEEQGWVLGFFVGACIGTLGFVLGRATA